jgi:3-phosphoshikimate 1-carboxyvinyltransferase
MKVLEQVGAEIVISNDEIKVSKKDLRAYNFDATDCPDLFPVLASLAANCSGESVIKGVSRLAHKESDRALAIKEEFFKIGIQVDLDGDFMKIKGGKISGGVTVSSRNDHRMAFSLAVATLNADKQIVITDAQSVKKSYPRFWEDFEKSVEI